MKSPSTITIRPGDPPLSCQHYHIDNETWQCQACGERMLGQDCEVETVLSAPNAAGCANPACKEALANGTYDETNPPAGCTNPDGVYVPDNSRAQRVVVGYKYTYTCERCRYDGTVFEYGREPIWECGHHHRGADVAVAKGK